MNEKLMDYLWSIAPPEAEYIAKNSDGDWYWYESEPAEGWASWSRVNGKFGILLDEYVQWEDTLTRRPADV